MGRGLVLGLCLIQNGLRRGYPALSQGQRVFSDPAFQPLPLALALVTSCLGQGQARFGGIHFARVRLAKEAVQSRQGLVALLARFSSARARSGSRSLCRVNCLNSFVLDCNVNYRFA